MQPTFMVKAEELCYPGCWAGNLYAGAHAMIYPPLLGFFGLPLIEAQQRGIPVAAAGLNRTGGETLSRHPGARYASLQARGLPAEHS